MQQRGPHATTMAATSDSRTGTMRPRRSASRPTNGDSTISTAAAPRNAPAMTTAPAPSRLSRSGASTSITPRASPARNVSHIPTAMAGSATAGRRCASV